MASLRARILASVLILASAGLVALAFVTYTEQRSFLQERVDRQVREAVPALAQILDSRGFYPPGSHPQGGHPQGGPAGGGLPGGGPGPTNLPPGTYGQRREASGRVLGSEQIAYVKPAAAAPKLPARVPIEKLFTVGSVGSSGLHYRVYVHRDPPGDGTLTLAAVPLREVDQTLSRLLLVEGLVIAGVLVALGASAFFVVRLGLRPLDRFEVTAGEIAAGDLSRRVSPATSRTEIGRLGLALNAMLERLERAFEDRTASEERLRQFLSDASHELRTPLASIRGYAELFRMGATSDAEGTELAMRRIEDEATRMGVLVEDLLTLARLDESPELRHEPVELVVLAREAVQDARVTAPQRAIELRAPASAVVCGDSHQLRQILANLLRNALTHTPAGTPIEVALERDEGAETVTLRVRDHGAGIPPAARERLFERFWRAEKGRERGRAGAGLGLAIVSAIVEAHHGRIGVRDTPGGGAELFVELSLS
jgi:two-component system OmpR family sensor kinase